MIRSVVIDDSSEDVIYLFNVSNVAVGHTVFLFFSSVLRIVRLPFMKFFKLIM